MIKTIITIVLSIVAFATVAANDELDSAMMDRANEMNSQLSGFYHDADSLKQNLTHPLMSDERLKTADGTRFDANIGCQSSNQFMQLLAMPASSGEVSFNIELDGDMDGQLDSLFSKAAVSGVCANGYIQCDVGTWENCRHFEWHVGADMSLDGAAVPMAQRGEVLKSCYCVNNACGNGLVVKNFDNIIKDVGSGIANAFQKVNPYYTISAVQADGPVMRFYGQEPASCQQEFNGSLTGYKSNGNTLSAAAFSAAQSDRVFSQVSASMAAGNDGLTIQACRITRELAIAETQLTDVIEFVSGHGSVSYCGSDCIELTIGQDGDDYWQGDCTAFETTTRFNVKRPGLIRRAVLTKAVFDDWLYIESGQRKVYAGPDDWDGITPSGDCERKTNWNKDLSIEFTDAFMAGGLIDFNTKVLVAGKGEGYTKARIYVDLSGHCEISGETINHACQLYDNNQDCQLKDESVDGVKTWIDFVSTGLVPVSQTEMIGGEACAVSVTRDWFVKQRKYACTIGVNQWDFSKGLTRLDTVTSSASTTGYTDQPFNLETGSSTNHTMSLAIPDIPAPQACVQACKTRRLIDDIAVNNLGNSAANRADSSRYETFYHQCGSGSCPLGPGEALVKACQCMNEFAETASIMQILRLSGKDMICTSGDSHPVGQ